MPDKLRIGVLLDGELAPAWIVRLLADIDAAGDAEIALVLTRDDPRGGEPEDVGDWDGATRSVSWRLWLGLERLLYAGVTSFFEMQPLPASLRNAERLSIPRDADPATAPLSMLRHLRLQKLDVLLQLGATEWGASLCGVALNGLWRLRSGDRRRGRRGPPGFWEVALGEGATTAYLEMLTPDALDGQVLAEGGFTSDDHSVLQNRAGHYAAACGFVVRELAALRRHGVEVWQQGVAARMGGVLPAGGALRGMPALPLALLFAARVYGRLALRKLRERLTREQWVLMYSFATRDKPDTRFERFRRITPPKDRFWADPFVVHRRGRWYVFFEELVYREERGVLACLELRADGGWTEPRRILELPYHLSYPHVFEHAGEWYMVPETHEARTVDLYRATEFPYQWEKVRTLMSDIEMVDATLCWKDARWWLFGNVRADRETTLQDALYLYTTDDLLEGVWQAHPDNPIVIDATKARPAGAMWWDGQRWLRPSQDSTKRYGYGLKINEVLAFSAEEYRETTISQFEPNWAPDIVAVHTISFAGGLTVIDAGRKHFR